MPPPVAVQRIGPDQSGYFDGSYFDASWAYAPVPAMHSAANAMALIELT
jgi:hypothetical protein